MRALLSVANRDGIADLARDLAALDVELYATDGTRAALAEDGIEVSPVSALTDTEALAGGQVKTFHPQIYAGILARRQVPDEIAQLAEHGIGLIDLVVVNVKPFAPQLGSRSVPLDEAIEMIDVGGTALLTAAARNYAVGRGRFRPAPLPAAGRASCARWARLGRVPAAPRRRRAGRRGGLLRRGRRLPQPHRRHALPEHLAVVVEKVRDLAYGENPHQEAAFYRETTHRSGSLADAVQLQGDQPTLNDLLDLDAAYRIASDFTAPTCCIVKQTNPTGTGLERPACRRVPEGARGRSRVSAFGAVVALNREVDGDTATPIAGNAYEAVVAPAFSARARDPGREAAPGRARGPRASRSRG